DWLWTAVPVGVGVLGPGKRGGGVQHDFFLSARQALVGIILHSWVSSLRAFATGQPCVFRMLDVNHSRSVFSPASPSNALPWQLLSRNSREAGVRESLALNLTADARSLPASFDPRTFC